MSDNLDLNPFFFPGNGTGVLLIHGYTGSPPEMRGLGEYLAERGLTVLGVRLAGHGTQPEDMLRLRWQDWAESAVAGLQELKASCQGIFVAGLSMGGCLALHLAANYPVEGVVSMAAPTFIRDWRAPFVPILKHFIPWYESSGPPSHVDPATAERCWSYPRAPGESVHQLFRLMRHVRAELPQITAPILVMHGRHDTVVAPECAEDIYHRVRSADKQLVWLPNSGHIVTWDADREEVWRRTAEFVEEHSRRRPTTNDQRPTSVTSVRRSSFVVRR